MRWAMMMVVVALLCSRSAWRKADSVLKSSALVASSSSRISGVPASAAEQQALLLTAGEVAAVGLHLAV